MCGKAFGADFGSATKRRNLISVCSSALLEAQTVSERETVRVTHCQYGKPFSLAAFDCGRLNDKESRTNRIAFKDHE